MFAGPQEGGDRPVLLVQHDAQYDLSELRAEVLGMIPLAECGAAVALEIKRGGVEESDRDRAEQRFAVFIQRLLDGIGAMTRLTAVLALDRLPQPGHGLVGLIEHQIFRAGDFESLLPCAGTTVR